MKAARILLMTLVLLSPLPCSLRLDAKPLSMPKVYDIPLPDKLTLCGEKIPLENPYVWEMMDREFTIAVWDRAQVFMWLKRAHRYFPQIEAKLADRNMPDDLKYLAVAESSLLINIRSRRGAMGPWQFMPYTAKKHGLRKDRRVDERRSIHDATLAALQYLKQLHEQFGSWILAMAAYNCGENGLSQAIEQQQVNDYFRLNLPKETERYIFRIAAIKIILQDPEKYGYYTNPDKMYPTLKEQTDTVHLRMEHEVEIVKLAQALKIDYKTIKELNPHIIGKYLPTGQYLLTVPKGLGSRLEKTIKEIVRQDLRDSDKSANSSEYYIVQPGDTLTHISIKTKVPLQALKDLNNLDNFNVWVGQKLRLK